MLEYYKRVLNDDSSVECGRLSLCIINHYYGGQHFKERTYQVDCDHAQYKFSKLYTDMEEAVREYLKIKRKLGRKLFYER